MKPVPEQRPVPAALEARLVALLPQILRMARARARKVASDSHLAEELYQAGAQAAWERLPAYDPGRGSLEAFCLCRARGGMLDWMRFHGYLLRGGERSGRTERRVGLEHRDEEGRLIVEPVCPAAERRRHERESQDRFHALLQGLKQTDRLIVTGYFAAGQNQKEIARGLEMSESRVSQRLSAVLARLRTQLAETLGRPAGPPGRAKPIYAKPADPAATT